MKTGWLIAALAALLMANPAATAADATPQALALAQRYMAATGGMYQTIEQQAYVAAGIMGDTPTSHARQHALQEAADQHRAELTALDGQVAALMAQTFTEAELTAAVTFLESPVGRAITEKKNAYFAALFARDRPALGFTPEENAALAAFDQTPEAISMKAKAPALLAQTLALSTPVQRTLRDSAKTIYCHETRKCTDGDNDFDQRSGPTLRE
ncbi:MAG TPA: DUF2059 domain-containing protein [Rhizomicrobium sp.]|jgi:hypothetical protein|nr:DUF2059 domain-containing protein [Rhizomicrobium sp.]